MPALLMLEPGSVLSLDGRSDLADRPPQRAEVSVRGYVSNLRKALVAAALRSGWGAAGLR